MPEVLAAPVMAPLDHPFLSGLFSDNMVLQRDRKVPIWGWTDPGDSVAVSLGDDTVSASAGPDGKWMAWIGPHAAGGPFTIEIRRSGSDPVILSNVLFGDVWICSGQSNMEMGIGLCLNPEEEIAAANYPNMRLYVTPMTTATRPRSNVEGTWRVCTPENVTIGTWEGFSAAAYYFGRDLHRAIDIPIGLIQTSWGGTPAEAWTSRETLRTMPEFANVDEVLAARRDPPATMEDVMLETDQWADTNDPASMAEHTPAEATFDDSGWRSMALPTQWEQAGLPDYDGIVWFRREFELTEAEAAAPATLSLGPIDDRDTTWVNGVRVGATSGWNKPRAYPVPAEALRAGVNTVSVRVLDVAGAGGIWGNPEDLRFEAAGGRQISLVGPWKYLDSAPLGSMAAPPPDDILEGQFVPTMLFNAMIAPLLPGGMKGAIWYQGESNTDRAEVYYRLLPAMIGDWRSGWGQGDFPFLIVQLAGFEETPAEPTDGGWARVREAQAMTAKTVPNVGLAVAIDIGEWNDIHPRNKQDIGGRLARVARAKVYEHNVDHAGPHYKNFTVEGNRIRLHFDHVGAGLLARDGGLRGFSIAGADGKFVWADAKIDGDTVLVSSATVASPEAVRYGWSVNPDCNLYNAAGLPAVPFRTDTYA